MDISIRGAEDGLRANAACIPPSSFSLSSSFLPPSPVSFSLGRAALAGPGCSILPCLLSPCNSFSVPFRTEQRSSSTPFPDQSKVQVSALPQQASPFSKSVAMGNLVWHEYARYVAISANACECTSMASLTRLCLNDAFQDAMWGAFWGILYRKFIFDFVNGIVRGPGGVQ